METAAESRKHQLAIALQSIKSLVERIEMDDKDVESSLRLEIETLRKERNDAKNREYVLQRQLDESQMKTRQIEISKRPDSSPMLPPRPRKVNSPCNPPSSPPGSPLTSDSQLLAHLMAGLAARSPMQPHEAETPAGLDITRLTSTSGDSFPVQAPSLSPSSSSILASDLVKAKSPIGRLSMDFSQPERRDSSSSRSALPLSPTIRSLVSLVRTLGSQPL